MTPWRDVPPCVGAARSGGWASRVRTDPVQCRPMSTDTQPTDPIATAVALAMLNPLSSGYDVAACRSLWKAWRRRAGGPLSQLPPVLVRDEARSRAAGAPVYVPTVLASRHVRDGKVWVADPRAMSHPRRWEGTMGGRWMCSWPAPAAVAVAVDDVVALPALPREVRRALDLVDAACAARNPSRAQLADVLAAVRAWEGAPGRRRPAPRVAGVALEPIGRVAAFARTMAGRPQELV